jgi:dTMP kinase
MLIPGGFLVVFEGIGGSGKSTLAATLGDALERQGWPVERTCEPGGTKLGLRLRAMLKGRKYATCPWSEAFLFEADRAQTYSSVIEPALRAGRVVVSDRGPFGTIAYQGFGRRLDLGLIRAMNEAAWCSRRAHLVFVLDIDSALALQRVASRHDETDRFDEEKLAYQETVRQGYLTAAHDFGPTAHVLDGARRPEELFEQAWTLTQYRLNEAMGSRQLNGKG